MLDAIKLCAVMMNAVAPLVQSDILTYRIFNQRKSILFVSRNLKRWKKTSARPFRQLDILSTDVFPSTSYKDRQLGAHSIGLTG
jgi:hypothetical protein